MQIENNKEEVPFSYYEGLFQNLDPAEAVARTGVQWDGEEFYVNLPALRAECGDRAVLRAMHIFAENLIH